MGTLYFSEILNKKVLHVDGATTVVLDDFKNVNYGIAVL